ncbi:acyl carrier protein [Streptomyces sp. 2A115]|uniref:acyl carrier protein n=1 Tax=Streptomyces sp. 2A115 TaxID=3457439 RepID=UPI003FCF87C4
MPGRRTAPREISEQDVVDHILGTLAELLELRPDDIDPDVPLSAFGINSVTVTWLTDELERWCGAPLERELFLGRPSVAEIAQHVAAAL